MKSAPPNIALLTDRYLTYQAEIIEIIADELNSAGYGVLCIAAKELQEPANSKQSHLACNAIYSQVNSFNVQGLISLSGTLGHGVPKSTVSDLLDSFQLPKVSLGLNFPHIASVYFEEQKGMSDLMGHLLSTGTRQRFAFVRGHHNDPYSMRREAVFRESLYAQGHSDENIFYVEGDYNTFTAYKAVTELLNSQANIDCIVSANDVMAVSAARAVKAYGKRIPRDVTVSGFDDSYEASQYSPALTTVRQPIYDMAHNSVLLLLDQINRCAGIADSTQLAISKSEIKSVTIDSELVVRKSTIVTDTGFDFKNTLDQPMIRSMLHNAMRGLNKPESISLNNIADALWGTLEHGSIDMYSFTTQLTDNVIIEHSHWWLNLCDQIRSTYELLVAANHDMANIALVNSALSTIKERIWSLEMDRKFEASRMENDRSDMQLAMSSCKTITDIQVAMGEWLAKLRPARCFLVLYVEPDVRPDSEAQLIHVCKNGESETTTSKPFDSNLILPKHLEQEFEHGLLVFAPIYAGHLLFGYLLIDPSDLDLLYIDAAAQCIGNAMQTNHHTTILNDQKRELRLVNANLEKLVNFDSLTGLANRLKFQHHLQSMTDPTSDHNSSFALLFIDLDGFKAVNDTLGHGVGDQLLNQVAKRLLSCVSESPECEGFIARLGGDEFTIILHQNEAAPSFESIGEQILELLSSDFTFDVSSVSISASIGCALYPNDTSDAETLVNYADLAMYCAKNRGKNNFAVFSPEMLGTGAQGLKMDAVIPSNGNTIKPDKAA